METRLRAYPRILRKPLVVVQVRDARATTDWMPPHDTHVSHFWRDASPDDLMNKEA